LIFLPENESTCNVEDGSTAIEIYDYIENQREAGNFIINGSTRKFMKTHIRTKEGNIITESLDKALKRRLKAEIY